MYSFSVKSAPVEEGPVTKRAILSRTAQLFDPLGWLAPVVVRAKIQLQSTWLLGVDWDTPLPDRETESWRNFVAEFPLLARVRVPRWLPHEGGDIELHGFADASERAYAAVVYLRTLQSECSLVSLIAAKTRVAPLKPVSLPRLELCAAHLLARLMHHVRETLNLEMVPLFLWSDSTVALSWLRGHPSRWQTYVAN